MVDPNATIREADLSAEVTRLKKKRGKIKGRLTSSEKLLANINEQTNILELNVEDRLKHHLQLWDEFKKIQDELEFQTSEEEDLAEALGDERTSFEDRFHRISALFKKLIKSPRLEQEPSSQNHTHSVETESKITGRELEIEVNQLVR